MINRVSLLQQRVADLTGHRQLEALNEMESSFNDIRVAWLWAAERKNFVAINAMLTSLNLYCSMRSRYQEGQELFRLAREHLAPKSGQEPNPVWGRILLAEAMITPSKDNSIQIQQALSIAQKHGDQIGIALSLQAIGDTAFQAQNYSEALSAYEKSLAHFQDLDNAHYVAITLSSIASTYRHLGNPNQALKFARRSLELCQELGDRFMAASSLANTGVIAFFTGNFTESENHLREASTIYHELGFRWGIAKMNLYLARSAFLRKNMEQVKSLAQEALAIGKDLSIETLINGADSWHKTEIYLSKKLSKANDDEEHVSIASLPTYIDRFKIKRHISTGGEATVYLAYDPQKGHDVVMKVDDLENAEDGNVFKYEADIVRKLKHPNIPEFIHYGETVDHAYFVMEFIEGKDLLTTIEEQEGFLPTESVVKWMIQACDILIFLHGKIPTPMIFRDMKPANLMINQEGKVYLIDFGILESYQAGIVQKLIGTEGYSPPEQYHGYADARSDIYALGATMHQLITRRDPRQERPFSFHEAPPRSVNPVISKELEKVILKAVEHHPEDRYQSTEEIKLALLKCLD
jgi:tetratricopeptide (TPR) repeat protein/predicted Ser/Thr protein kinase